MNANMTREQAVALLRKYNQERFHLQHALTVEGVMRWYAGQLGYGGDADFWALAGLLHDVDFERWPERHCVKAPELLREANASDELIHAVVSHGYQVVNDVEPTRYMEKVLFTVDELSGLINATAIMRPSHSLSDLEVKSVKKKFKDQRFAAGVDRALILKGCEMLGMELDSVIDQCIQGMRENHEALGL